MRRPEGWRVWEAVKALALCHNVTPVYDNKSNEVENKRGSPTKRIEIEAEKEEVTYQASSPDEIALVKWTEQVSVRMYMEISCDSQLNILLDRTGAGSEEFKFHDTSATKSLHKSETFEKFAECGKYVDQHCCHNFVQRFKQIGYKFTVK